MNLVQSYAHVILSQGGQSLDKTFMDRLLSYMKTKGHLSLLPHIVRVLERTPEKGTTLVRVAQKDDVAKYKHEIEAALKVIGEDGARRLEVDPNVVGGYMVLGNGKTIDKTFRSALVSFYQNVTRS